MHARDAVVRVGLALALVAAVGACGRAEPRRSGASIDLFVSVCHTPTCFTAPVPGATVTVTFGGRPTVLTTDEHGVATFTTRESGTGEVTATWAGLDAGPATVSFGGGSWSDVRLGFPQLAKIAD